MRDHTLEDEKSCKMTSSLNIDDHKNEKIIKIYRRSMQATHDSLENQKVSWRMKQIDTMEQMLIDHEKDFVDALYDDLKKDSTESLLSEILTLRAEIKDVKKNLSKWMAPKKKAGPLGLAPCYVQVRYVPLCSPACLLIAPFNYPVSLSLFPAIGALAGGNPVILKASELCPVVGTLLEHLVSSYFDEGVFRVINGGVQTATSLLRYPWGLTLFTGSERVGKIVAEASAKTLTPVVLELGGKSPLYFDEGFYGDELKVAADRIMWGKTMNSGQTCIAPDYVLCHESQVEAFTAQCVKSLNTMFGEDVKNSGLSKIVSEEHTARLTKGIQEIEHLPGAQIIYGGSNMCSVQDKFIMPTILLLDTLDHPCELLQNEIFGPILPIVSVKSEDEAVKIINKKTGTPLALYAFTKSASRYEKIISHCPAANYGRNDVVLFFSVDASFGGKGSSGSGMYKGKGSFRQFTKPSISFYHPCGSAYEGCSLRYHPYDGFKKKIPYLLMNLPTYSPIFSTSKLLRFFTLIFILKFMIIALMYESGFKFVTNSIADVLDQLSTFLRNIS